MTIIGAYFIIGVALALYSTFAAGRIVDAEYLALLWSVIWFWPLWLARDLVDYIRSRRAR